MARRAARAAEAGFDPGIEVTLLPAPDKLALLTYPAVARVAPPLPARRGHGALLQLRRGRRAAGAPAGLPALLEVNAPMVDPPGSRKRPAGPRCWAGQLRRWAVRQALWSRRIVTPLATTVPPPVPRERIEQVNWGANVDRFHPGICARNAPPTGRAAPRSGHPGRTPWSPPLSAAFAPGTAWRALCAPRLRLIPRTRPLFPGRRRRAGTARRARRGGRGGADAGVSSSPARSRTSACRAAGAGRYRRGALRAGRLPAAAHVRLLLVAAEGLRVHGDGPAGRDARYCAAGRDRARRAGGLLYPEGDDAALAGAIARLAATRPRARRWALRRARAWSRTIAGTRIARNWSRRWRRSGESADRHATCSRLAAAAPAGAPITWRGPCAPAGHAVAVVRPRFGAGRAPRARSAAEYDGLPVAELPAAAARATRCRLCARNVVAPRGCAASCWPRRRRLDADLIHAQHMLTVPAAVGAAAAWGARGAAALPVVATVRDYWPLCYYSTMQVPAQRRARGRAGAPPGCADRRLRARRALCGGRSWRRRGARRRWRRRPCCRRGRPPWPGARPRCAPRT